MKKTVKNLCVIAGAITYGFATVGKANVQKALLFVTALFPEKRVVFIQFSLVFPMNFCIIRALQSHPFFSSLLPQTGDWSIVGG